MRHPDCKCLIKPIFNQEDPMPTNLPDDFQGTGKPRLDQTVEAPEPTDEREHPIAEGVAFFTVGCFIASAVMLASSALLWVAMAILHHLP